MSINAIRVIFRRSESASDARTALLLPRKFVELLVEFRAKVLDTLANAVSDRVLAHLQLATS